MARIGEDGKIIETGSSNGMQLPAIPKSKASKMLMTPSDIRVLDDSIAMVNLFINHSYLSLLKDCSVVPLEYAEELKKKRHNTTSAFELTRLVFSEKEDLFEKLITHYASFNGKLSRIPSLGIIIKCDGKRTRFYLCCDCNDKSPSDYTANANDSVSDQLTHRGTTCQLINSSFNGLFPGSELRLLTNRETADLMNGISSFQDVYVQSVSSVPSRRQTEQQNHQLKYSAQGIEKYIDAMKDRQYTLIILAQPIQDEAVQRDKQGLEQLYTAISPYAKESVSFARSESDAANLGISKNMSRSVGNSLSQSYGTTHTTGKSSGRSGGSNSSVSGQGFSSGSNYGWSSGWNESDGTSTNHSSTETVNFTDGKALNIGVTTTTGTTSTVTMNRDNKTVQDCMERIKNEIERIDANRAFGMWNVCSYVLSEDNQTALIGASTLQALLAGDAGYGGDSYSCFWSVVGLAHRDLLTYLSLMQHPIFRFEPPALRTADVSKGIVANASNVDVQEISPALMVAGKDLPVIMSLPKRSVPGVQVLSIAEFGRNFPRNFNPEHPMLFGSVIHMGNDDKTPMLFNRDSFAAHSFICGASGTGKSNTTFNLLNEFRLAHIPFLVIEPVKGEYKREFGSAATVFTTLPNDGFRNLYINPFEFHNNVNIVQHMDYLNSAISSCWPLYGTMPSLLKQAIEEAYINCGWDIHISQQIYDAGKTFPTFADVLPALERIINDSDYSAETKGEYKGALCMRIRQLMIGFEGRVFCHTKGVPDDELFNKNTIIDLSSLGNDESRALIMAILVIKLREYRYATQKTNNAALQHITVLEEAHNILKRCSHEQSQDSGNAQGKAVETLVNCIAEMRSTGEGFMIIDQSPSSVDEAAIKNTAIKIAMRLPSENDAKAIGHAVNLQEEQVRELSRLETGVAVVFHENWNEAVLGKMGQIWKDTDAAKQCRLATHDVLRGDVIKYLGVVAQWACIKYLEDPENVSEIITIQAARELINKYRNNSGSMTDAMWDDIELQIRQMIAELKSGVKTSQRVIGDFLRELLQIDDLFRMPLCKLKLEDDDSGLNDVSDNNAVIIDRWWKTYSSLLHKYIQMPMKFGKKNPEWIVNRLMEADGIKAAVYLILASYFFENPADIEHVYYNIARLQLSREEGAPLYGWDKIEDKQNGKKN